MKDVKQLQFTDSIVGNRAYMLLNKQIGYDDGVPNEPYISGALFQEEMYYLKSQGYNIQVKINSPGGSTTDGASIMDGVTTTAADTHVYGLAASIAGIIALSGRERTADDVANAMVHPPKGGAPAYLEMVTKNLSLLLDKRTKFSKEKITEMMEGKSMHWFDSSQMLEMGMIDKIVPTNQKFIKPVSNNVKELYQVYNSLQENNNTMWDSIKALFPTAKNESEGLVNVVQMRGENESLKGKIVALEAEVAGLKTKLVDNEKAAKTVTVNSLIEDAVNAGKIKEDAKGAWIVMATTDFANAKNALDSIAVTKTKNAAAAAIPAGKVGKEETLTYAFLTKNNPKELERIYNEDPDQFDKLLKEFEQTPAALRFEEPSKIIR